MCGIKSRMLLCGLVLALLLSSVSLSAEEYAGPELPEGWYPIHETELIELENLLNRQDRIIELQDSELSQADNELSEAENSIENQETTINALETSLTEYESEVRVRLWTTSAISFGIGVGVGAAIIAIFTN